MGSPVPAVGLQGLWLSQCTAMRPDQASLWYRRMSMVYAIGVWSLLGSLFLLNKREKESGDEVEKKDDPANEVLVTTSEIHEPLKGLYVETIVTYRKDYVPLSEKIHNYLKSWTGGSGPES
uniref:small integral membrane protein 26 n=1 Tax=Jaculus jaculus TaxID=51337 RepID=UPI001E1B4ABE|nr:small integral membrane protein 26 [Jaculus jaculus]